MALAAKPRFAGANLGFMCGPINRLTVVDVDSPADSELQHALATYGDTGAIVRTPSGGRHLYYRHDGEGRVIRPDPSRLIDMLGGGLCLAPPSARSSGASYAWQRGSLDVIANDNLPKIRNGAVPRTRDVGRGPRVQEGERNAQLFRYCRQIVAYCDDLDALIDAARNWADNECCRPRRMPRLSQPPTAFGNTRAAKSASCRTLSRGRYISGSLPTPKCGRSTPTLPQRTAPPLSSWWPMAWGRPADGLAAWCQGRGGRFWIWALSSACASLARAPLDSIAGLSL